MEPNIKTAELLISLLRAALRGSKLTESPLNPDILESVYRLAKFHSVDAAAYYGIVRNDVELPEELQKKWSGSRNLNIAKTVHEVHERDNIYSLFSQSGTDFLPLKGLLIKPMYPASEYRQMADLDILVREEQLEQAGRLLEENGYRCVRSGDTHHDSFFKPPYISVELHHEMVDKSHLLYNSYYKDIWEKVHPTENGKYEYRLSWSDFYIFMLVHFAKHYNFCGSGIRSIMDIFVFLQKHAADLDEEYLSTELEKLELSEFRKEAETLAGAWFGEGENDALSSHMALNVISSGTYGTRQQLLKKRIKESSDNGKVNRVSYVIKRLFPNRHFMAFYYPEAENKPYLLPWFWMKRIAARGRKGIGEYRMIREMTRE